MNSFPLKSPISSLENHLEVNRFIENEVNTIDSALSILKREDSASRLVKNFKACNISSMDNLEIKDKLTSIAAKIIAHKANGGQQEKLFNGLEGALTNQLMEASPFDKAKIENILKHLSLLKSAMNHEMETSEESRTLIEQWSPQLLEKGKAIALETAGGIQQAIDNLSQLLEILPELALESDLLAQFKEMKFAVENELNVLRKLENQEDTFEKIIGAIANINRQKQEMKSLIVNVKKAVDRWEAQVSDKITFKVDGETDISKKYGYKFSRLLEIAELLSCVRMPGTKVLIPKGISTDQVNEFLKSSAPSVNSQWNELCQLFKDFKLNGGVSSRFLKQPNIAEKLEAIRQSIIDAFAQSDKFALPSDFLKWMEELKAENSYLMVRSSGAEDTRKTANAGGNVSVAYVNPERRDLLHAVGKVVASYSSESSLQNRLNAGEDPFSSPLCLGVAVQELIGEPVGGASHPSDIPVSLVLFSNEPTYVGNEPFRLMRISATWGHGEGVVGAVGIKSDTILLLKSVKHPDRLYIIENNQAKPKRLTPKLDTETGEIKLEKMNNPPELDGKPALDQTLLTRLFYLGVAVEKAYEGHPMDLEIVIKNGMIFPVQARPINRPPSNPTYFDWKKASTFEGILQSFQAEAFLPGIAEAQVIRSKEEIILSDSLENAEKLFDEEKHKLVIIREEEPANSHPAINFSGNGIPVMYHEEKEPIQSLVDQIENGKVLIACVQSGNLVLWDSRVPPESTISTGYTVHPAKVAVSVSSSRFPSSLQTGDVPQEIKDLTLKLRALDTQDVALEAARSLKNVPSLVELRKKKKILANKISSSSNAPKRAPALAKGIKGLEKLMAIAASELKATLKKAEEDRLHPLFHGKVVEALFQQPEAPRGLGQLSVVNVESQLKAVDEIFRYQESFDFPTLLHDEVLAASACMTLQQESQWKDFLTLVENAHHENVISLTEIEQFKQMLIAIENMNLLPLWMARFFLPESAKMDPQNILSALLKTIDLPTEKHISEMQEVLQEIQAAKDNLKLFSDAATFDKGWKQLMDLHQKLACLDDLMENKLKTLLPLGRIVTYQVMEAFVDLYDSSIKSMKSSLAFTGQQKVELFAKMLKPYLEMLNGITGQLSGNLLRYHRNWPLDTYLNELQSCFEKCGKGPEQLKPSRNFSVNNGILGMITDFGRALPKTHEDVFTLIHQNLLFSLGALLGKEVNQQLELPSLMQEVKEVQEKSNIHYHFVGCTFSNDQLVLKYNYPLRNHSAIFSIIFDKKNQSCLLDVKFMGFPGTFDKMYDILKVLNDFKKFEFEKLEIKNRKELNYTMKLSDRESMIRCFSELEKLGKYTLSAEKYPGMEDIGEYIEKNYGEYALLKYMKEAQFLQTDLVTDYFSRKFDKETNEEIKWNFLFELCELEISNNLFEMNNRVCCLENFIRKLPFRELNETKKNEIRSKIFEITKNDKISLFLLANFKNIEFTSSELRAYIFTPSVINGLEKVCNNFPETVSHLGKNAATAWSGKVRQALFNGEGIQEVKEILNREEGHPLIKKALKEVLEKLCGKYSKVDPLIKNDLKKVLDEFISIEIQNLFMPSLMSRLVDPDYHNPEYTLTPLKYWKLDVMAMLEKGKAMEEVREVLKQNMTHPLIKSTLIKSLKTLCGDDCYIEPLIKAELQKILNES